MVNFRIKVLPDGSTMIFGDILIFYKKNNCVEPFSHFDKMSTSDIHLIYRAAAYGIPAHHCMGSKTGFNFCVP